MEPVNYISLAEAAERCEYSQEYLSLRARQGKLKAVKQGRNWVTTYEWLLDYLKQVDQVKQELKEVTVSPAANTTSLPSSTPRVDAAALKRETIIEHHPVRGRVEAWLDEPVVQNQPIKEVIREVESAAPIKEEVAYLNESEQLADALLATEGVESSVPVAKVEPIKPPLVSVAIKKSEVAVQSSKNQLPVPETAQHEEDIFQQVLHRSQATHDFWPEAPVSRPTVSKMAKSDLDKLARPLNNTVKKEKSSPSRVGQSLKWQPVLVGALVMALAIEVGVLVRPIGMAAQGGRLKDISTKMSVGLAVLTGNPPALTWKAGEDQPVIVRDTAGMVAGAQTEREDYTVAQKIAAGFLMFIDPGADGTHSGLGNWLMDTFNLPDAQ